MPEGEWLCPAAESRLDTPWRAAGLYHKQNKQETGLQSIRSIWKTWLAAIVRTPRHVLSEFLFLRNLGSVPRASADGRHPTHILKIILT